jgi:SnoaL-like domain
MNLSLTPLTTQFVESMNAQNSAEFIACFAPDAVVEDEGHTHCGTAEIQAWIEEAFRTSRPILKVTNATFSETGAVLTGDLSGSFPGSPIVLHYHLTIAEGLITGLKCAL